MAMLGLGLTAIFTSCKKEVHEETNVAQSSSALVTCEGGDDEDPRPMLYGTVKDKYLETVAGACVKLYKGSTLVASTGTNSVGHYYINSVDTGSYDMYFSATGSVSVMIPVTVDSADHQQQVNATLQ